MSERAISGHLSLRARLTVGTAFVLALAIATGLLAAYSVVRGQLRGEIDRSLKTLATPLIKRAAQAPPPHRLPANPRLLPGNLTTPTLGGAVGYVQLVNSNGTTSLPSNEHIHLPLADATAVAAGRHGAYFTNATVNGTHLRIYTTHLDKNTAIQIARPLTEVDHALSRIRLLFLLLSLSAIAGAAILGLLVSLTTLRPVKRLTDDAERIATTRDLSQRTDQNRTDELGRLAVAFNTMLDALAESVSAQRQLVADASHELRTPLTSIRTNLEVLELHEEIPVPERRRILAEAVDEVTEMTHLIEELVELARGDAQIFAKQPIRLDLLADEAVTTAARRSNLDITLTMTPTTVYGDPKALARAIGNLLDNAIKWNLDGMPIEVTAADGAITVRDHGPGIDPDDQPHIFDRFYRATTARTLPGSGLGLAIVRQVAETHDGTVTAKPADGGGTLFTLHFPTLSTKNATAVHDS
jgi:two-component system, OmpR family, sensor histidine kinase MprB